MHAVSEAVESAVFKGRGLTKILLVSPLDHCFQQRSDLMWISECFSQHLFNIPHDGYFLMSPQRVFYPLRCGGTFVPEVYSDCHSTIQQRFNVMPPVHWDVEHVSGAHDSLIANNIFKIWKLLIVWVIKINLALSVTGVMNRVWIETFKLVWREEDASLMAFNLCKEILLLVIMCWRHIALHAYEQEVGCQLSPASLGLLLVDPVPVKTKKVNNDLLSYCVVQRLLQIYP